MQSTSASGGAALAPSRRTSMVAAAAALYLAASTRTASSQIMTNATPFITEMRTWALGPLAVLLVTVVLIGCWIIMCRNFVAGAVIGLGFVVGGALAGHSEIIATALGFTGGA